MTNTTISLAGTRTELDRINTHLRNKCGPTYRIHLDQYRFRDMDASVYDTTSDKYDLLLCLYYEHKCVSSVAGRYSMELLSKTDHRYEGLKFNLLLRSVFMYLMCFVRPTIQTIYSYATNPISTYAMYKHYRCSNPDLQEYVAANHLTADTFTAEDARKFHQYYFERHRQTDDMAQQELRM